MRPDGTDGTKGREANYNIYRSDLTSDESGVIKREILKNTEPDVESWGIGTLIHIFDTSGLSGDKTDTLEHSNQGLPKTERNVYSSVRLTAVALTTELTGKELSNNVQRLNSEVGVASSTYEPVVGLTTSSISLPIAGDIYVAASINSKAAGNDTVGEYKLEYLSDAGGDWSDLGKPVKRSMINNSDNGIVSLVGLLETQNIGSDYQFRVAHKRITGTNTVVTHNSNICGYSIIT